ncbi:MAG: hydantoinase B/oxoprolinase family protein, partial [Pseudomonadota bacterium]
MVDHFGLDVVRAYMGHVQDNAEECVRRAIVRLRDADYTYLMDPDFDGRDREIRVSIRVDHDAREAAIDFTGTTGQLATNYNAPEPVTRAAVLYVFRCLVDDDIPMNEGVMKPLKVILPEGSMISPQYPAAVIAGLEQRLAGVRARVTLLVNTQRMARRLRTLFDAGPPRLLPRIRMLTALDDLLPVAPLPPAASALERRLQLVALVIKLIQQDHTIAPDTASFDLADSLATLMDEMQGEGVSADDIARLDVSDQSGHWARAQQFIAIAQSYIDDTSTAQDPEARQRATVERLAAHWAAHPPADPILIVGSTGSRGTTQMLMQAVARLPQGAVILPGFDSDMPADVWNHLAQVSGGGEDHPQFRFLKLAAGLGIDPASILAWSDTAPVSAARNRLVSLALRPAPVTDAWLAEGPALAPHLPDATAHVTLVEAETPR